MASTRPASSSGLQLRRPLRSSAVAHSLCTVLTASRPVTAVTRRTPLATPSWLTILKKPAWPVCVRCVPPQNSTDVSAVAASGLSAPISSTRTGSGYFSPNTARTPGTFFASASGIVTGVTGRSA